MRKTFSLPLAAVLALAMMVSLAGMALAQGSGNPHFVNSTASVDSSGNLVVKFKEAGLGSTPVNITASADATANYGCVNRGGKHPQASNKETSSGPVSTTQAFTPRNGQISGTLTVSPPEPPSGFSCPGNQRLVLADVTYTNVKVVDTTDNITATIPGTFTKTFFTF